MFSLHFQGTWDVIKIATDYFHRNIQGIPELPTGCTGSPGT